jgi:zinc protease
MTDLPPTSLPPFPPGTTLTRLPNGLQLILREDHSAPVVSAQAWAMTGSIHEGRWLGAGLSHVLEHMLFKGTTTRGAGRIDQEVQEAGGYMNAYTSFDRTVYWINVPNTGARVAVDILCDVMQHAALPPDDLAKEMDVIRREMDMGQDDPGMRASRRLFEVAYTRSPYRLTVIGYPDIFNQVAPEDIRGYYRERYAPNNLFFVVVGDMNAQEIEAQIRAAFQSAPEKALPPMVLPEEPRQIAPRMVVEEGPIELGHLHCSWHIPDLRHPDVPVLDVLAVLLGMGRSSRLYREVRERQGLVHSVDAWTYNPGNPGLIGLSAVVDGGKFEAAREALWAEVERVKQECISPAELTKAVKQFVAGHLSVRKTMQGQANDLGSGWLAANDLNFSSRYLDAVKRVAPADLQRVARQYLTPENRTLYALLPTGTAPQATVTVESSTDHPIQKFELPNGLRLLVKEDHRLPFVEFRSVLRGGVLAETTASNGITQLMSRMLLQGTTTRSAEQIAREIESVGGSADTFGGNNSFGVSAEVMREDFTLGLDLVADLLRHPVFPGDALEREREIQLAGIAAQRDEMLRSAAMLLRRTLFGNGNYGLDSLGTEESVAGLSASGLADFHRRLAVPNNCVLAIYGDVEAGAVRAAVEKSFDGWAGNSELAEAIRHPAAGLRPLPARAEEVRDKKQAVVIVGFPGVTLHSPDRYALELLQESCSDLGSRLFLRIREKLGLAYYTGAMNFLGLVPGFFAFYAGTEPAKAALVEQEMLAEAEMLRRSGLDEDELRRAKAKVIGQKKIARQELGGFAMGTALDELYGLGYANQDSEDAQFEAVTCTDIVAVAQKFLRVETAATAIVRPAS